MEKLSEKGAEITRTEWRELGFFYESNEELKRWDLYGSKAGLGNLVKLLNQFALREESNGEHEHLGPHWYFTLTSSSSPMLDKRGVWGSPKDFKKLAKLIDSELSLYSVGECIEISDKFCGEAEFCIALHIKGEAFDSASLDQQL